MNIVLFAQSSESLVNTDFWISTVQNFENNASSLEDGISVCYVFFCESIFTFCEVDWFVVQCYKSELGCVQSFNRSLRLLGKTGFEVLKHLSLEREHVGQYISIWVFYNKMTKYFYA